jgi:excisionase family DNA binding protein
MSRLLESSKALGAMSTGEPHVHDPDAGGPYLTTCQLAGIVQVSDSTVYRWAVDATKGEQRHPMPVLRLGSVVRFPRDRVLAWLRDRERDRRPRAATLRRGVVQRRAAAAISSGDVGACAEPCAEGRA